MRSLILALAFAPFITMASPQLEDQDKVQVLTQEWNQIAAQVQKMKPDHLVGGLYNEKFFNGYSLLWKFSNADKASDVIRFFRLSPNGQAFTITYYRSSYIIPGRLVLRRLIGYEAGSWINHTLDLNTKEYLGSQGTFSLTLSPADLQILKDWQITPLE